MFKKRQKTKKLLYLLMFLLLFAAGYMLGMYYTQRDINLRTEQDQELNAKQQPEKVVDQQIISTDEKEDHITISTKIKYINIYDKCGHEIIREDIADNTIINLNERDFSKLYDSWDIVKFTTEEVVLSKHFDQYCPRHYLIIEKNGNILVQQNILGTENMKTIHQLDISVEYLPSNLREDLAKGIILDSKEELLHLLEDIES